jgi:hypothetical protein
LWLLNVTSTALFSAAVESESADNTESKL